MIPSALVAQLERGMKDFLRASFWSTTPGFDQMMESFLEGKVGPDGLAAPLFQGPFVSVKLPFQTGSAGADYFPKVPMPFPPYGHQQQAFERLGASQKENTIVATGTGSGKTECFLYPVLDHCARNSHRDGVKAILIYPMNALAQDQAERLASVIWNNENLRGKVTAGLYVGSKEKSPHSTMGERHILTDKELIRKQPPHILLTNYKMLDYLLARPRDQALWMNNGPETLQFLVVDELHTFDGAQGTDLACLIRRLKARLLTSPGHLTCVGTSATLGGSKKKDAKNKEDLQARARLVSYAEEIFGETFGADAVVTEARQTFDEFIDVLVEYGDVPQKDAIDAMDPERYQDTEIYTRRQQELWFGSVVDRVELGRRLKKHMLFQNLVRLLGGKVKALDEVVDAFRRVSSLSGGDEHYVRLVLVSLLAMVSSALRPVQVSEGEAGEEDEDERTTALVQLQMQLWQREMRRMVASVGKEPALRFYDDMTREQRERHLPVVYCRECGTMGWATMVEADRKEQLNVKLKSLYAAYFSRDDRVRFFFPAKSGIKGATYFVNPESLERSGEASDHVEVVFTDNLRPTPRGKRSHRDCPGCGASDALSLIGFQAATLTSTYINQLFASGFNDDKKLLTFSDSVQDAAHRAGFFEARTWRFNLRVAIQKVIEEADDDVALADLSSMVADYWRSKMELPHWVATFIAPNMSWMSEWEKLKETGKIDKTSSLIWNIEHRLSWEVYGEFTLNARIGRTLPRSGASIAYVEPALVEQAVESVVEPLRNELGGLRGVEKDDIESLITGLLRRLIERGAVYQPELHESYLETGGENTYVMSQRKKHLPNFSPGSRLPGFLASNGTSRFEALTKRKKSGKFRGTWYDTWFARCLESKFPLMAEGLAGDAWLLILEALVDANILERRTYGGTHVWGFRPEALQVTKSLVKMRCSGTGEVLFVANAERDIWERMPSMSAGLAQSAENTGYQLVIGEGQQYYAELYRKGDVQRIVAEEHTGLLQRDDREELERRFKSKIPEPWYPNLLSCTPTLEMGIDIGDLSTAILCSVPPTQANYLQRIGRAGRRDGNALLLTLATARAHDLYFFAEPEEMIAGQVDTPGVFLNASAVLERQLTAFCMDSWAKSGVLPDDLPTRLNKVFEGLDKPKSGRFPHNFLHFIETNETNLLRDFLALFEPSITEDVREHLTTFMRGGDKGKGSLRWKILDGLASEKHALSHHGGDVRRLRDRIKKLEAEAVLGKDQKDDLESMRREKSALQSLMRQLGERQTMNFFTDEGLMPNYAFPEAGVNLKSIIWRKRREGEDGQGKYKTFTYEYERPARSAIRELAPRNRFYAGGRQVSINRVDVGSGEIEEWQFCDNCHHAEVVFDKSEYNVCPACGSAGFGDVSGQKKKMLKMRQVYANTSDRDSRIADDQEERRPMFYNKQMLVSFAEDDLVKSWCITDESVPFGYEYIRKTNFREVNFGEYSDQGEKLTIGGVESIREGFGICADCGMIQKRDKDAKTEHSFGCPSRSKNHKETILDCLFLYRAFSSEAIRMLLPFVDRPGYQAKMQSFVAALEMGLKEYFAGQIDHLETTIYSEPGPDQTARKQFLVIYDTVPGGTGYLKELLRGEQGELPIFDVFRRAREILTSCACTRDEGKDGCYKCLYAYRNSYDMPDTSRDVARDVLTEILEHEEDLEEVESLGSVSVTGLFDSALEARFIEALRQEPGMSLEKRVVENKSGFRYRHDVIDSSDGDRTSTAWNLLPQQLVTKSDGVAANVEIDCLIRHARSSENARDIAVFTDGFQFHAGQVGRDLYQRMGLVRSGRYRVWSLTWHDVEDAFTEQARYFANLTSSNQDGFSESFFQLVFEKAGGGLLSKARSEGSLKWLKRVLQERPGRAEKEWRSLARAMVVGWLDRESINEGVAMQWRTALAEVAPPTLVDVMTGDMHGALTGMIEVEEKGVVLKIFCIGTQQGVNGDDLRGLKVLVWLDDRAEARDQTGFQVLWNGYLRLFNLLQFLPECYFVTSHRQDEHNFATLVDISPPMGLSEETDAPPAVELAWEKVRAEMLGPEEERFVDSLFALGMPLPEAAFPLLNDKGRPTQGMAELAWLKAKVAVIEFDADIPEDEACRQAFEEAGWTTLVLRDVLDDAEAVRSAVEGFGF